MADASTLTMYSTTWCGYCRRLKTQLDREGIAYTEVDIEAQPEAADFVMKVNNGNQTVPTVLFPDGVRRDEPLPRRGQGAARRRLSRAGRRPMSIPAARVAGCPNRCSPGRSPSASREAAAVAAAVAGQRGHGLRLGVEGPVAADAAALADAVAAQLAAAPCPWRGRGPRSSCAHGRCAWSTAPADPDAFFDGWYDLAALRREVLDPLGPGGTPVRGCRACGTPGTRPPAAPSPARRRPAPSPSSTAYSWPAWDVADAFDLLVHLDVTAAGRARRVTADEQARVLPAWERYLQWYDPAAAAGVRRPVRPAGAPRPARPAVGQRTGQSAASLTSPPYQSSISRRAIDTRGGNRRSPEARSASNSSRFHHRACAISTPSTSQRCYRVRRGSRA